MIVDLVEPLLDLLGEPIRDVETPQGYTVGLALLRAALYVGKDEAGIPPESKFGRYELARKIAAQMREDSEGRIDLSTDELKLIRDQVGRMYLPLVMGQIWRILDAHTRKP